MADFLQGMEGKENLQGPQKTGNQHDETMKEKLWGKQSNGMSAQHAHAHSHTGNPIPPPPAHIFTHKHTHTETETRLTLPSWYKTSSKEGRTEKREKKGKKCAWNITMGEECDERENISNTLAG